MPTIKLVVIGPSGVGKTSLRGRYISGRFSNGYRATIGADFISKTLPHPTDPEESVVLQIWDTAGQERFSSLSSAFFRGADAAILMFDVNEPATMVSLKKWWADFKEKAPLGDGDVPDYCCIVVGNKIDMKTNENRPRVTEWEALSFLDELVPPPPVRVEPPLNGIMSQTSSIPLPSSSQAIPSAQVATSFSPRPSRKSHTRSPSRLSGTVTSTKTTITIYHTPSSSFFESYYSARSSPEPGFSSPSSPSLRGRARRSRNASNGSGSSSSGVTITPSIFARDHASPSAPETVITLPDHEPGEDRRAGLRAPLPHPERGPKLFFTSAKTGEGVADVFDYIAQRVVGRWAYEEQMEAQLLHYRDASGDDTVRVGLGRVKDIRTRVNGASGCCA